MVEPVSIALITFIVASVLFLAWYTAQKDWNVEREADARRDEEDEAMPLIADDEEEG